MNGTFVFILMIIVIVMTFQLAQTYLENKKKKPEVDTEVEDTLAKIEQMEDRIKVLERIVTESRFDLKKEINSL